MRGSLTVILLSLALASAFTLRSADSLFADPVIAQGKGIEIRASELEDLFAAYKAARAALGQIVPPVAEPQIRKQVLEKLVATRLILARATAEDRDEGKKIAGRLIEDGKKRAPSESSYRRQLIAMGTTPEKYEAEMLEQAIVKSVLDRELKNKTVISDADVAKYYEEHAARFTEPEKARVSHILFAMRRIPSGDPLPPKAQKEKKVLAEQVLARARAGQDFAKLVREFSEVPESKQKDGELIFPRGGPVPPQFEAAVFSLQPGQISDLVESVFGVHVIKLIELTPPARVPLDKVAKQIRDRMGEEVVQQGLNEYVEQLKREAGVVIKEV